MHPHIPCGLRKLYEPEAGTVRPVQLPHQPILALRSLRVGQLHDATADPAQPMPEAFRRYLARIAPRGSDPKQERLEFARAPVVSRRCGDRLLDDGCGQIGRVEVEAVLQPEAEELADVSELHILVAETLHADDRIRLAQPN